jgi:2-keto-4-pentenoate hydratase/2-oxohepta-3-ene-1,7-dioic acid hydratase in catechol pathway
MSITPAQQLESLIQWAPVSTGDLLFTGTPQGVAQLQPGDVIEARLFAADGELLSSYSGRCR